VWPAPLISTAIGRAAGDSDGNKLLMLAIIAIILILLWAVGLGFHIAGSLIHIILVFALISLIFHFVTGRKV